MAVEGVVWNLVEGMTACGRKDEEESGGEGTDKMWRMVYSLVTASLCR